MPIFNKWIINRALKERFEEIRNDADRPYIPREYPKAIHSTCLPTNPAKNYEEWRRTLGRELNKIPNRSIVEVVEVER